MPGKQRVTGARLAFPVHSSQQCARVDGSSSLNDKDLDTQKRSVLNPPILESGRWKQQLWQLLWTPMAPRQENWQVLFRPQSHPVLTQQWHWHEQMSTGATSSHQRNKSGSSCISTVLSSHA